jgi:hypothetical protein
MRNIVEKTYRITFHLQYKNQPNDSKNKVIYKLHETFPGQWSIRPVRLAIAKTYNKNKNKNLKVCSTTNIRDFERQRATQL